ncbi:hypothetical protein EJ04DRAFT_517109 [Polyplosphaeria fusca]|uniref:Uncharacterized protein n=1 Tax=Polyplosphaeria fusca TaxID=682080 RepID=A0A9P4QL40_9PLEO|nr:hypothetical protein EJ04DRAFT_517109 [Polyplosphaeria fusca]
MGEHVVLNAQAVEHVARQHGVEGISTSVSVEKLPVSTTPASSVTTNPHGTPNHHGLSTGTIERQLWEVRHYVFPEIYAKDRKRAHGRHVNATFCGALVSGAHEVVPRHASPLAGRAVDSVNKLLFQRGTSGNCRLEDEESIVTNPMEETAFQPYGDGVSIVSDPMGIADGSPHPIEYATQDANGKSILPTTSRDEWGCDFCGVECFCLGYAE